MVEDKTLYISRMQAKQLLDQEIRYVERTVDTHGQHIIKIKIELSD